MDTVHTANKIYKSKESPEIQQNSGLFHFTDPSKKSHKDANKKG